MVGRRVSAVAVCLAMASIGLAACSSSGSGSTTTTAGAHSGGTTGGSASTVRIPSDLCSLISATDLTNIMGQTYPAPTSSASGGAGGGEQDCQSSPSGGSLAAFSLFAGPYCTNGPVTSQCTSDRASVFASNKSQGVPNQTSIQDISGLGSQAYCASNNTAGITQSVVAVLSGWIYITATADNCSHAQQLATLLLGKLTA